MDDALPVSTLLICLGLVWAAAATDLRTRRIPNLLSVTGALLGLLAFVELRGVAGIGQSLAGLGLGMGLMLPGYLLRSTGAGDVKLMGAVGAVLGWERVLLAFVGTMLAGAAIGLGYALVAWWSKGAATPFRRYGQMLRFSLTTGKLSYLPPPQGEAMGQRFAFALPIAIGATLAAIW